MDVIYEAFILRFIVMILLFKLPINNIIKVILILLMDCIKGIYIKYRTNEKVYKLKCDLCKTWRYQFIDKWLDLFGYYLVYLILKKNNLLNKLFISKAQQNKNILTILLYTIYYRLIGVILFSLSKKSYYLVIFADLFKEFLIYDILMKNKPYIQGYYIIFILKILFEYYWHQKHNKTEYKDNLFI